MVKWAVYNLTFKLFCYMWNRMDDPEAIYKFPSYFASEYEGGIEDGM